MKRLLMAAVALVGLNAAPAMAEDFTVQGTVNAACSAITTSVINFGTIGISSTTGLLNPGQSASPTPTEVWCNGVNSTLSFTGGSISNGKGVNNANFTSTLTFTPSVTLGGNDVPTTTAIGAVKGSLVVTAGSLSASSKLPTAGDYTGTITVTLAPAV